MKRVSRWMIGIMLVVLSGTAGAGDVKATLGTGEAFVVEEDGAGEVFRVQADGKVGIGDETPDAALDVNGTVRATALEGDGTAVSNVDAETLDGNDGADYILSGAGVSTVNQVVRGTVSMGDSTTEASDTLSATVDPARCTVNLRSISGDNGDSSVRAVLVKTLTSTEITLQKTFGNGTELVAEYEIVEYR